MRIVPEKRILPHYLEAVSENRPDRVALIDNDTAVNYGELRNRVVKIAAHLRKQGVTRGDRVVIIIPNSIEFVTSFWAVQYLGGVAVPLNPEIKSAKLRWIVSDCQPAALLVDALLDSRIEEIRTMGALSGTILWSGGSPLAPSGLTLSGILDNGGASTEWPAMSVPIDQDLACIIYTSGSTGTPKGVMLSHLNMVTASSSVAEYLALAPDDRIFCAIPFSFDYGLHQITMTTLVGASLIIEARFSQPLFSLHRLVRQQATVFPIVPTMISLIEPLARRFDFRHIRTITSTAAALHPHAIDRLQQIFSRAQIFSMYGLTECHRCTYLHPNDLEQHKSSVGKAIPNTELWVIDDEGRRHDRDAIGEVVIRGSTVMKGYWNSPEKTDEVLKAGPFPGERVFHTGDICRIDEDGYLYFVSRKDDVLKVKGEKVAPKEVEAVLAQHRDVLEVTVIGIPHEVLGDEVIAFVVRRQGAAADDRVLRNWCAQHLESFMVPNRIVHLDDLPKNRNGKIDRQALAMSVSQVGSPSLPFTLKES